VEENHIQNLNVQQRMLNASNARKLGTLGKLAKARAQKSMNWKLIKKILKIVHLVNTNQYTSRHRSTQLPLLQVSTILSTSPTSDHYG